MIFANKALKYLILFAALLLVVAISSFWFGGKSSFSEKDVKLELESPLQASAGDEVVYKIKYANATKTTLHGLNFLFFYPEGATFIKDGLTVEGDTEGFEVEELAPGQKGEKEIKVFIVGDRGNIKTAKVTLSFRAGNLQSSFEKAANTSTTIVSMPVELTLVAPPNITSGQPITYILDYRNISGEDISDLFFEVAYPEGFSVRSYDPQPDQGNNAWIVPMLDRGSGERISIQGILEGKEGEAKSITLKLKRKIGDIYVDYERASSVTMISSPILGVGISVNESSEYSAYPGDSLRYVVQYANNSNFNISGLNLSVKLEGEMFDFASLNAGGGFFDDSTKTILWNASTLPDFINLSPGARGQVNFRIALKQAFASGGSSRDRFVKVIALLNTPNVLPDSNVEEIAVSISSITKIGTQPTVNQLAYYNDPVFGSSGPLPPRAGEETIFTIHWQITNPGNDIGNAVVKAKLSSGVSWMDQTSAVPDDMRPSFNPNTQEVSWSLPVVPFGIGVFTPKYEGVFRVKIKPSSIQRGSFVNILEEFQFLGTDNFTKLNVIIRKKDLNTEELTDRPKEGTVQ
ncbi:MAG: hypothetical protein A3B99_02615 [Candidatus Yanofskybacteria bacterium RIFCSPHIGHO2_02_FULL_44_12b]|uniref:DUF11 domain-containing protein n=2 Tax=Candidatus Yanofskyibacteriota TaxID=1752733 RepID=A0A1F8GKR1_9BACT|nr:MAG: hypothetical protein UW79_C0001G0019 [Candidatus Yanofskybacteria bacterium GW2011_GWA2_44_9]OGN04028.1 MAG: hypothetical protein A2659_00235 [Candidatus Yanofskybacteria bacterium RIFCSPHIGHO2_01_FULL_44_24]OGN15359.1 MAG: hypothetical protein A3B99_02615 [Candidatus Yanofskybacteria bacterium RIFCSPHIGHO2_02_FULL_44_12b]OGN25985.1 MAG: hypothetical protein A2925_04615 [Candidatus Yanofskybacteria bacterium RIFCSPLOWO2_01_FULL_44_22]